MTVNYFTDVMKCFHMIYEYLNIEKKLVSVMLTPFEFRTVIIIGNFKQNGMCNLRSIYSKCKVKSSKNIHKEIESDSHFSLSTETKNRKSTHLNCTKYK